MWIFCRKNINKMTCILKTIYTKLINGHRTVFCILLSLISTLGLLINLGKPTLPARVIESRLYTLPIYRLIYNFIYAFSDFDILGVLVFAGLFAIYYRRKKYETAYINKALLYFGSLFAMFMLTLCKSYYKTASWDLIFGSETVFLIALFKIIGVGTLIYAIVSNLCSLLKKPSFTLIDENAGEHSTAKLTLLYGSIILACWIPYIISLLPGCFTPDSLDEIAQFLGKKDYTWSAYTVNLLDESVLLNNHHPFLYTLLLGAFSKLGRLLGSYEASFILYSLIQISFLAYTLGYSVAVTQKHLARKKFIIAELLFFILNPLLPIYGMTVVKDTYFCVATILLSVQLYEAFTVKKLTALRCIFLSLTILLFLLIRNNSIYIMALMLICIILLLRKDKKRLIKIGSSILATLLIFQIGIINILCPALKITPGSKREMLSVPFLQTARYIKEHPEDISEKDEEIILTVLRKGGKLEDISNAYSPSHADSVKNRYNKDATNEQMADYFKVWFKGLKTHPDTYIEAYLNLHYGWFSFEGNDFNSYSRQEPLTEYVGNLFPEYDDYYVSETGRGVVNTVLDVYESNPVTASLIEMATYTWIYVFLFFYGLKHKRFKALTVNGILFFNYLISFVGPVAYMRYAIPMVCTVMFSIFITLKKEKQNERAVKNG